jgi:3',5'-cyclic AMP phosphodiesterase CpdA
LLVPWRWVTGNHDILNQGTFRTSINPDEPLGTLASTGTRDWSLAGGPVRSGDFVAADPSRYFLDRKGLMARVALDGDGHGLGAEQMTSGRAHYSTDVGAKLRVIALDTAAETGSGEGVLHQKDIDGFLKPALEAAKVAGKLVIITSHHASGSLTDGSETGGTKQSDAVTTEDFQALIASYPNVIMHLAGHSHVHAVKTITGTRPYWEVKTSALADFPNQLKVFELWDTGEGHIVIRAVTFDFSTVDDPLAAQARAIALTDYTSGYTRDGRGAPASRNVELWIAKP